MEPTPTLARRFWQAIEPLHGVVYFHPDPPAALAALGLKGFYMAYFAGRFGPLGPVGPGPVTALAFNFAPARPARALPDAWARADPATVVAAWAGAGAKVLRETLPATGIGDAQLGELAHLLTAAAAACHCDGRALAAAWQAVEGDSDLYSRLWLAATVIREHRGDGHVAAATVLGLRGLDAAMTHAGTGSVAADGIRTSRGWTEEEWAAGRQRLHARGWLDENGYLVDDGVKIRENLENITDHLAEDPIEELGDEAIERAIALAVPLGRHFFDTGLFPVANPMGAVRP